MPELGRRAHIAIRIAGETMFVLAAAALFSGAVLLAQNAPGKTGNTSEPNGSIATFQTKVNLVLVPVVVRDKEGRAVAHLTKNDFEVIEKRKRQPILTFSEMERGAESETNAAVPLQSQAGVRTPTDGSSGVAPIPAVEKRLPGRYVAYLFDDLHTNFADIAAVRQAAVAHLERGIRPTDRAAVYTISGRGTVDFTGDKDKLIAAVKKLALRQNFQDGALQCPNVSYYLADLVLNQGDERAKAGLVAHTISCTHLPYQPAEVLAMAAARQEQFVGEQGTRVTLRALRMAIWRLSQMPGERLIIMASPGFYMPTLDSSSAMTDLLNLAERSNVVISSINSRGLFTLQQDASERHESSLWLTYVGWNAQADGQVLADLADGTGGTFFHNYDDLKMGFDRLTEAPDVSYVLGFAPVAKADGRFHPVKVRLLDGKGLTVSARRGYFAAKEGSDVEMEKAEMDDAVFSRADLSDLLVHLQTGYSKVNATDAKLAVISKVDVHSLHFARVDGRNSDAVTVVLALFDSDGGYVTGVTKTVNLKLTDETLKQLHSWMTVTSEFPVKPGSYAVRMVVREAGSKEMGARSGQLTVP